MAVSVCLSCSPDAQPEAQRPNSLLNNGFLYCIFSATSLDPNSSGPQGPFGLMWLSLPHLDYNSVRSHTATHQGPQGLFGLMWLYLPPLVYLPLQLSLELWLLSRLSYIIVQCPLNRLLDLWNRMLDRRQAEITVMQFRGHSLPVHQSMSVPWEFFYLVPFRQPISAHAISFHNCH